MTSDLKSASAVVAIASALVSLSGCATTGSPALTAGGSHIVQLQVHASAATLLHG